MTQEQLLAIWYRAKQTEFGVRFTPPTVNFDVNLYTARKASGDTSLDHLRICKMKDGELWIVKKELKMEEGDASTLP